AGLQTWVALPDDAEEVEPSFVHVPRDDVPAWHDGPVSCRLIAGSFAGHRSPVLVASAIGYVDAVFDESGSWTFGPEVQERGVVVVDGQVSVDGFAVPARHMLVLDPGA